MLGSNPVIWRLNKPTELVIVKSATTIGRGTMQDLVLDLAPSHGINLPDNGIARIKATERTKGATMSEMCKGMKSLRWQ